MALDGLLPTLAIFVRVEPHPVEPCLAHDLPEARTHVIPTVRLELPLKRDILQIHILEYSKSQGKQVVSLLPKRECNRTY